VNGQGHVCFMVRRCPSIRREAELALGLLYQM
jgi:hypothetical protein